MGFNFRKTARAVLATLVAAVTLLAGSVSARAAQKDGRPGYYSNPGSHNTTYTGSHGFVLGPEAGSQGAWKYCIEAGTLITETDGDEPEQD